MNELVEFMGYNGPNPNKQLGGALRCPVVAQLTLHSDGDILVIVSTGSDMWWEHGGKCQPEVVLHGGEVRPFNNLVERDVLNDRLANNFHFWSKNV